MATILGRPGADPGRDDDVRIVFHSFGGPSGATLLGRFCPLDDGLTAVVRDCLRREEAHRPEAIFAEIVHLPEGRIGNIIYRPVLRDHEIPFLGTSGVDAAHQLPLEDLLVSVQGGRIVLRSRSLAREIVPRLTTAHNYFTGAVGIYKFLCLLQNQGYEGHRNWSWGPLGSLPFLPRISCGRLVLSLATWRLDGDEIRGFTAGDMDDDFRKIQELRERRNLPRYLKIIDGDNAMPVDLDNPVSVEVMRQLLRKRGSAVLQEFIEADQELIVQGEDGGYCHEVIVPFVKEAVSAPNGEKSPDVQVPSGPVVTLPVVRHAPGSEWLYTKLYCGTASADQVLRQAIAPVVRDALARGAISKWFFIRFSDPNWHLRLRFLGDPGRLLGELLPELHRACDPLLEQGMIRSLVLDTYIPEQHRYGGPQGLAACQSLFMADSDAIVDLVTAFTGDQAADLRWLLAMRGVDSMLTDLGYDTEAKLAVMDGIRESFWREHNGHKFLRKQIGLKYRKYGPLVKTACAAGVPAEVAEGDDPLAARLQEGCRLLDRRSTAWQQDILHLRELADGGNLMLPLPQIAASLAHMHCNRLLRSAARAQEMVIYDFLCREYRSQLARARKHGKTKTTGKKEGRAKSG